MKKIMIFILIAAICAQFCACQSNPLNPVVTNRNNGDFESNIMQSAPESEDSTELICYADSFTSTDGSVEYKMSVDQTVDICAMPVVEVIPHNLTGEDVKNVANVLFEGSAIYERETDSNPQYSRTQLQNSIARWSQYTNKEKMASLLEDNSTDAVTSYIDYLEAYIELYTEWLESAPEENPHTLCEWTFKKEREYNNSQLAIGERNISDDLDVIYANVEMGDLEYNISATTHDKADYKLNTIIVSLGSGLGPTPIDLAIYRAMLCRTDEPTDLQISAITNKVGTMLENMDIGDWTVANTYISTTYYGEIVEYKVCVDAVPVFNGVSALHGQNSQNFTANDVFVASYPISKAYFEFAANGDLVYFRLDSPIDVNKVINSNVETLSIDELIEKAKNQLMLSDAEVGYGLPDGLLQMYEEVMAEEMVCKIDITTINYGLARVNVADNDTAYYYIPEIVFRGKADYYGKNTEELYVSSGDFGYDCIDLVWINGIDGSIIGN